MANPNETAAGAGEGGVRRERRKPGADRETASLFFLIAEGKYWPQAEYYESREEAIAAAQGHPAFKVVEVRGTVVADQDSR